MAVQFDVFSEMPGGSRPISRDRAKPATPEQQSATVSEDEMVRRLSQTGRYRILIKLKPRTVATIVRPEYPLRGIILDTETTRTYCWSDGSDDRPKSWWIEVGGEALNDELHYLRAKIYRYPEADPPIKRLTAFVPEE